MRNPFYLLVATLFTFSLLIGGCGSQIKPQVDGQTIDPKNPVVQETLAPTPVYKRMEVISSPEEAKQLLIEGNERFTSGKLLNKDLSFTRRSDLLKNGQHPFAVIVCCSDSRVPPELLFDQALGDLFVVRVAGNVITPVELGSVEYAVEHLKTPLVVVLGHEECGAVTAAVQGGGTHGSIEVIVKKIQPAVEDARALGFTGTDLVEASSDLNIQNSLTDLLMSPIIKESVNTKALELLGGKYDLDKGVLEIFHS